MDPSSGEPKVESVSKGQSPFSAPAVSLPKGGGAIHSIGEKFAANPVTGTGSMSVPISVSPGRSGLSPQLSISYNSGNGNNILGFGWSLSLASITRKTDKGLPRYNDTDESDVFILSGSEDLVPVLKPDNRPYEDTVSAPGYTIQRYQPRIDGIFARIERWTRKDGDIHWRSYSKDNLLTLYGASDNSRIADPEYPQRIFSWLICETRDDKGNAILYVYKPEDGQGVNLHQANEQNRGALKDPRRTANRYIKHILYGNRTPLLDNAAHRPPFLTTDQVNNANWMFELVFDYGEHNPQVPRPGDLGDWTYRQDAYSSYRAGFEIRTTRLCQRVLMFHHFSNEPGVGQDCLVRSTNFSYTQIDNSGDANQPVYSFLQSITQTGYKRDGDGYLARSLPPLELHYTDPIVQSTVITVAASSLENLPTGIDNAAYQWIDLHGEGLQGILTEQSGAWFYKRNLSPVSDQTVNFAPVERVALRPNQPLSSWAQFMDLAGDGQPDLVSLDGPLPGLYEHDAAEGWLPFHPFNSHLNLNSRDPNLKFIDLDGDGHVDVLITADDALLWHASLEETGFGPQQRVFQAVDEEKGPRLVFDNVEQSIYLADMSGDGLSDLVRVRNGEVCYWPNLGYGRFGAKITMDNAPLFDIPDQFEQKRLRLADIDGSGTTDLIYLHRDGVRLYFNQSGNSWSKPQVLSVFPQVEDLATIVPLDLLGNGTACLVWSSPLPGDARRPMRYANLMGSQKPHLLVSAANNMGAETRIVYAPSTKFYLQDKLAGQPWLTRLPFPVHVVERVETYDHVSRSRFVTRYAYHHGYFDGVEREFRGFGMVEQWDTEELAALIDAQLLPIEGDSFSNQDPVSHVPPVHTKSWFHTGLFLPTEQISRHFEAEYYREPGLSDAEFQTQLLPDTPLPPVLTLDEQREASRALKGMLLRQEVYADDAPLGAPAALVQRANTPYTVTEQNFTVVTVQRRAGNRFGIFFTHSRETLSAHYERHAGDPRIQHTITLDVDKYGNVLKDVAISYGRRQADVNLPTPADQNQQTRTFITATLYRVTNPVDDITVYPYDYHIPLACETRTFELTGIQPGSHAARFSFEDWGQNNYGMFMAAAEIPYEQIADQLHPQKRLIEHIRNLYRPDDLGSAQNDPNALLSLGVLETRGMAGESFKLAFTPGLLAQVYRRNGQALIPDPAVTLGGPGPDQGGYAKSQDLRARNIFPVNNADPLWTLSDENDHWWIPAGRIFLSPDDNATAQQEMAYAANHFFTPHRYRSTFEQTTFITYDDYDLLLLETSDSIGNRITVGERRLDGTLDLTKPGNDYRVLEPYRVMDANRNRSQVAYDVFGQVVATALMGKPEQNLGDALDSLNPDLPEADILNHLSQPLADPATILGRATSRLVYDLFAYYRSKNQPNPQPSVVYTLARETHDADLTAGQPPRIQLSFSYSDGFGREIQKKIQAEPGPAPSRAANGDIVLDAHNQPVLTAEAINPRWVASGWTIFNNKGSPVRQYQAFFSDTHRFEFGVRAGVSPVLFYDPLERVIATLQPNQTYRKVVFNAWQQATYDENDTSAAAGSQTGDPRTDPDIAGYVAEYFKTQPPTWKTWFDQRQGGALGPQEQTAAAQAAAHADTPTIAYFDSLGRTFLTISQNKVVCPDHDLDGTQDQFAAWVEMDIEGNQRIVRDAILQAGDSRGRMALLYDYDMLSNRIHQTSMEAGERWMLNDATGNPLYAWDNLAHTFRTVYDTLRRPLKIYVTGADLVHPDLEIMTERLVYGEQHLEDEHRNLRGKIYLHLDQAGAVINENYDFKGNLLEVTRRLEKAYKEVVNWSDVDAALPALAADKFNQATLENSLTLHLELATYPNQTTYDALNRPFLIKTPDQSSNRLSYNEANFLERVDVNLRGETNLGQTIWKPFITNIDYNADGQRLRVDEGNGTTTSYSYDPLTFRLAKIITLRDAVAFPSDCTQPPIAGWPGCQVQNLCYTYDPVGNITFIHDDAQQTVYFRNKRVEPNSAYIYDAVYRLIEARGREHLGQVGGSPLPYSYNDALRLAIPHPADGQAMGLYIERYVYDAVGNFMKMQHIGSDPANPGWTRTYQYKETSQIENGQAGMLQKTNNRLSTTQVGDGVNAILDAFTYNPHGSLLNMPQLQSMQWDFQEQLEMTQRQSVNGTDADGAVHQAERTWYTYDASGQRVRKITETGTGQIKDERIYLGSYEIYRLYIGANAGLVRESLHIADDKQRIALVDTRNQGDDGSPQQLIRYQYSNHLGSASLELDADAQIISYEEYTPFGSTTFQLVRNDIEVPVKRYRYTGKERDEETGFYYHGARYFAPWLGRWTSCDRHHASPSMNLFEYADSNPVKFWDPDGKDPAPTVTSYSYGRFNVSIDQSGAIKVKSGDWLSKYSAALHGGDVTKVNEYERLTNGKFVPVANPDQITAGETLYHQPTRLAVKPAPVTVTPPTVVTPPPEPDVSDPNIAKASADKPSTAGFGFRHPVIASDIGSVAHGSTNITTVAVRFSTRIGLLENSAHEGSEVNAFRHTLWQAVITKKYGASIAEEVGYAHEDKLPSNLTKRKFTGATALADADQTIDLLNNVIGREIGKSNPTLSTQELAIKVLERFHDHGLFTAQQNPDGSVDVVQTKISDAEFTKALGIIKGLNNDGYTASEQSAIDKKEEEEIKRMDRGPKL
jgi:RHS repeat-associated protein